MDEQYAVLRHSVAFRVTEAEWKRLQQLAAKEKLTVPQLAKRLLFTAGGLQLTEVKRRKYGHADPD